MKVNWTILTAAATAVATLMIYAADQKSAADTPPALYVANSGGGGITEYLVPRRHRASLINTIGGSHSTRTPIGVTSGPLHNAYAVVFGDYHRHPASKILIFGLGAKGNDEPISVIRCGGLDGAWSATTDRFGNIYVANSRGGSISIFRSYAKGCVRGNNIIRGPHTGLLGPTGVAVDETGRIYVTNMDDGVRVYAANSNGDARPIAVIIGSHTMLGEPESVALDAADNIYVGNYNTSTITEYSAGSNGDVAPSRMLAGSKTGLSTPVGVVVSPDGRIFVSNYGSNSISIFDADAQGNVAPVQMIGGSGSGLNLPFGLRIFE